MTSARKLHGCETKYGEPKLAECERCAEVAIVDRITAHLREWQIEARETPAIRTSFRHALEMEVSWLEGAINSIRARFR